MMPTLEQTQTRPVVIGGIYKYNTTWGTVGRFVVEGIHNEFIRGWILDSDNNNTGMHVTYTDERIDEQIGFDITYSPAYQALQDRLEHLSEVKQANKLVHNYLIEQNLPLTQVINDIALSISLDMALVEQDMDSLKASYKPLNPQSSALSPEPPYHGLSPLWSADRCEIPVSDKPKSEWQGFIGCNINVLGFAQGCTITSVFNRYGDEWAKLTHPRHGILYRKTKALMVKDLC